MTRQSSHVEQLIRPTVSAVPLSPSISLCPSLSPPSAPPLDLSCLEPVRFSLHSFWSERDAALLLRVSHVTSLRLLAGYSFDRHVFLPCVWRDPATLPRPSWLYKLLPDCLCCGCHYDCRPALPLPPPARSLILDGIISLCRRYSLRVRRLQLPPTFDGPLVDERTGQSLLPASLTELWLGAHWTARTTNRQHLADLERCPFSSDDDLLDSSAEPSSHTADTSRHYQTHYHTPYVYVEGAFNQQLPVGCLPTGLRILCFGVAFNRPLLPGSLPASLTVIDLTSSPFTQPIAEGVLPCRLRVLLLSHDYNHSLPPGVLPASLRRLCMGRHYNQPLVMGGLPPQLQCLEMGYAFNHPLPPGVIPPSCTALLLSTLFDQPLSVGSLPCALQRFEMGKTFHHPLQPGVLPVTLLHFSPSVDVALLPGVIPPRVTHLHMPVFRGRLQPGAIPPSVQDIYTSEERADEVRAIAPMSARIDYAIAE